MCKIPHDRRLVDVQQAWTIREVARVAGRSPSSAALLARAGLLPGYTATAELADRKGTGFKGAQVPAELATAYAEILRAGVATTRLAELMKGEPEKVLAAAEALATLARTAIASTNSESGRAA